MRMSKHMDSAGFNYSTVIGIESELPGYRFCWMVNEELDIDFVRQPGLDILNNNNEGDHYLPIYQHATSGHRYLLYKLSGSKKIDLPESNINFLWIVQSTCAAKEAAELTNCLKDMPGIKMAKIMPIALQDVRVA
jgi:hypothetical protein